MEEELRRLIATPSDINEHLDRLCKLASECTSVVELGDGSTNRSLYALACGLLKNDQAGKQRCLFYVNESNFDIGGFCQRLFQDNVTLKLHFHVFQENILNLDVTKIMNANFVLKIDMLFIDSIHCFFQCYRELTKFAPYVAKYIVMHDTTIDETTGELIRMGRDIKAFMAKTGSTRSEASLGMKFGIEKFLKENSEWKVHERLENNNGLTILTRV